MSPTYFREAGIQPLLNRAGVDVTVASVTAKGVVDLADEEVLQMGLGEQFGKVITVVVKTGTFPALIEGVALTTMGTTYKVHRLVQQGDGATTKAFCAME